MGRSYLVVEGHGEDGAAPNLVQRLWTDLGLPFVSWSEHPWRCNNLDSRTEVERICRLLRDRRDCDRLLILRDQDDGCPRELGPQAAGWLREQALSFPSAFVLLHREYETLFLPCIESMAGKPITDPSGMARPGIQAGATFTGDPQARRDAKGVVSSYLPAGRRYKPTTDQLALTRLLDFTILRASGLPCFRTMENALRHLAVAEAGDVYPPAPGAAEVR